MRRGAVLFCEVDSLADQYELAERARRLDGVTEVHPYLLDVYHVHAARLSAWIDEALAAWDRARLEPDDR